MHPLYYDSSMIGINQNRNYLITEPIKMDICNTKQQFVLVLLVEVTRRYFLLQQDCSSNNHNNNNRWM